MTLSEVRKRGRLNRLFWAGKGDDPLPALLATAIYHYKETSIVGSPLVTASLNEGTLGSDLDYDVVNGTAANLTRGSQNGMDTIITAGSASLQTTAEQSIAGKTTEFMVARRITDQPVTEIFYSAGVGAGHQHGISNTSGKWYISAATPLFSGSVGDNNLHIVTAGYNLDATSYLEISDIGTVIGDAGAIEQTKYGTILSFYSPNLTNVEICEIIGFSGEMPDPDVDLIQAYLTRWFP